MRTALCRTCYVQTVKLPCLHRRSLDNILRSRCSRKLSTLVGRTGRVYTRARVLQSHPVSPKFDVYLAHSEHELFVLKVVHSSIFDQSLELKQLFGTSPRMRHHVDENTEESTLVYDYFQGDLLDAVMTNARLSMKNKRRILREVGLALSELHRQDWIHLDLKPNNILLNYSWDDETDTLRFDEVVLADLDCALKLRDDQLLYAKIGNFMWRSPEGQVGRGIGKFSEVFSFGLLCLFTIAGAETLHPNLEQLKESGSDPDMVILYKLLSMFGPVPPELIAHVDDKDWSEVLQELAEVVNQEDQSLRLEHWDASILPNLSADATKMILRMTNLDPNKRATIDEILQDPWWTEK